MEDDDHVSRLLLVLALACTFPGAVRADVVVEAPPALAVYAARVRSVDLSALASALEAVGLEAPSRVRATLLTATDPRTAALPRWVVGFAAAPADIVIVPERVLTYPYDSLESVVRHEIAHLALSARAAGRPLPRWFHEGTAVLVDAGWGLTSRLRLLAAMLERPGTARLAALFASDRLAEAEIAYLLSAALVDDMRRRYGPHTPGEIAARVALGAPFDRAFAEVTGNTPDAAAALAWAAYLRWSAWIPALTSPSATWLFILLLAVVAFFVRVRQRARRRQRDNEDEQP